VRVLLDTSGYAAARRDHREVKRVLQTADEIFLSPVVLGELMAGFRKGSHTARNLLELHEFTKSPRVQMLTVDPETAERYAVIYDSLRLAGTPVPTNDLWIAASAMQHGLQVLTTDAHYLRVKQILVDYYPPL